VVGASSESSSATGVDSNQSDNSALFSGAAYVFMRSGNTWSQQAYLKASNAGEDDGFGSSVAIAGDTAVIGAWGENSGAIGVNGDQSDNSTIASGAAYVFTRSGNTWSQQAYLKASNTEKFDFFGESVSIADNTIVVGAWGEDSSAIGVNGNQSDNSTIASGAAYVFTRSGNTWSQQAYLKASNTEDRHFFGSSVAITGNTIVIGASHESSNATGIDGNQSDNSAFGAGAVYVFSRSDSAWSQQAYLKASNTEDDEFGSSVAISGDTVVVGAAAEDSNATEINGDQSDNSAESAGAAYVFTMSTQQPIATVANEGLWWIPSTPGSGFDIGINSNNDLYMIWYTYTLEGLPIWYLASAPLNGSDWNADLLEFNWDANNIVTSKRVGDAQLSFQDTSHATLNWTLDTGNGSAEIEYFTFDQSSNVSAGTWFDAAQPGYGLTQVNQGTSQVQVLYFYDQTGNPVWALGSSPSTEAMTAMDTYTGTCPVCPFADSVATTAGTITTSFSDQLSGVLSTNINLLPPLSGPWLISNATISNLSE
jgi:hypothetical protein